MDELDFERADVKSVSASPESARFLVERILLKPPLHQGEGEGGSVNRNIDLERKKGTAPM